MPSATIIQGDWIEKLKELPDESVHCCVTSPPYWGLRDYGVAGQLGLEKSPEEYVSRLVEGFRQVRRVLRDDGTVWLNLGDSYYNYRPGNGQGLVKQTISKENQDLPSTCPRRGQVLIGLKEKDLIGIPWLVAFALRADGWYLRSDIIWAKPNCMPESVTDRPTRSHEYLFLLSKSKSYYYDADSIKEPMETEPHSPGNKLHPDKISGPNDRNGHSQWEDTGRVWGAKKQDGHSRKHAGFNERRDEAEEIQQVSGMRNKRDVWTVSPANFPEAHFATYPPNLIKPCILAGCPVGGTVLDPFAGSGTTGEVALELGRSAILIELNPKYIELIKRRTFVTPGLPL